MIYLIDLIISLFFYLKRYSKNYVLFNSYMDIDFFTEKKIVNF